jgi:acetyl-CoA carboxylase biotin carboxyl carrier protein
MIDIRKLKELVRLMVDNDLIELDLRDSEEQVTVRRPNPFGGAGAMPQMMMQPVPQVMQHAAGQPIAATVGNGSAATVATGKSSATATDVDSDAGLIKIESPMVGTFYATPNPDSPPFVALGSTIAPDKVVCIIEAMKIFNEIKSEVSGVIQKVLVKNGDPVEFGQPLFLVKPA